MCLLAAIDDPEVACKILDCLGLPARGSPLRAAAGAAGDPDHESWGDDPPWDFDQTSPTGSLRLVDQSSDLVSVRAFGLSHLCLPDRPTSWLGAHPRRATTCSAAPCIDPDFAATASSFYCSAFAYAGSPGLAWIAYFGNGNVNGFNKTGDNYVRAVRAGSCN